jgi:hypothetical protein
LNDATSVDPIVEINVARVDGAEPPTATVVGVQPGQTASFTASFDPGLHWVRVVFASGWQSRARTVNLVSSGAVSVTFLHAALDPAVLQGTWFGAVDSAGVGHTLGLTFDAGGNATRAIDGVPDILMGTLAETSERIYRVTWSDASVLALIGDDESTVSHAAVITGAGDEGVLERGATSPLPAGVDGDVVGTWTGVQVEFTGAALTPVDVDAAGATVSAANHWEGFDGAGIHTSGTTPLTASNAAFLRYFALVLQQATSHDLAMGLTKDRGFGIVSLTPSAGGAFPDAIRFQMLKKTP